MTVGIAITVDTSGLTRLLSSLRASEIPTAARNVLRDLSRDVAGIEKTEIGRVFDRPTPYVQGAFRVLKRAETNDLTAIVGVENPRIAKALKPSIPRFSPHRGLKGIEHRARSLGYMGADQWLVPSRTMRLDRYGNITRATHTRIMTDLALQASGRRGMYIYLEVETQGSTTSGIWLTSRFDRRQGAALQLVAVRRPTYPKRFDYLSAAMRRSAVATPIYARRAVEAIRRRHGGA